MWIAEFTAPVTRRARLMVDHPNNLLKAIPLRLGASLLFVAMAVLVRYLGTEVPIGEMIFFRGLFAIIPIMIFFALRGEFVSSWRTQRFAAHLVRGSLSIVAIFCYFGALARLPLADVTAISFLTPLITVALAAIFLGEIVHRYRWSAVIVGFLGVIIMLVPYFDSSRHASFSEALLTGVVLALLNAIFGASAVVQIRRLLTTETTSSIVMYFALFIGLGGLVTLPFGWVVPSPVQLLALVGAGLCGGLGHLLTTSSYRYADASSLAPFDYSSMIWAFLLGYTMFGEIPTPLVVFGALLVAAAGLFVVWRERQLGLKRSADEDVVPPAS